VILKILKEGITRESKKEETTMRTIMTNNGNEKRFYVRHSDQYKKLKK